MTLDRLRAYRSIELKLDRLREELAEHYACEPVSGSRGAPSFAKTTRYAEGYPSTPRVAALEREIAALEAEIAEVERFVQEIPDPQTRRMFELKFISGERKPTYWQVAMMLGGGMSEHCVRNRIKRFLAG